MSGVFSLKTYKKTISVTNTAEVVCTSTTDATARFAQNVVFLAPSTNAATVYFGNSSVTSTDGFPVAPGGVLNLGDLFMGSRIRQWDLNTIYVYGTAGDTIRVAQEVGA
jgi:hypothetical protein